MIMSNLLWCGMTVCDEMHMYDILVKSGFPVSAQSGLTIQTIVCLLLYILVMSGGCISKSEALILFGKLILYKVQVYFYFDNVIVYIYTMIYHLQYCQILYTQLQCQLNIYNCSKR